MNRRTSALVRARGLSIAAALLAGCATSSEPLDANGPTTAPSTAASPVTSSAPTAALVEQIQDELDQATASLPTSPGQLLHVTAPRAGLDATFASGSLDFGGVDMAPDATVRIASVTKTFVAAAVFRAWELGLVDLDATLDELGLSEPLLAALRQDGYELGHITVTELLRHTSGIADFAGNDQPVGTSDYATAVLTDPTHHWTPLEQIQFAVDHGAPLAPPGTQFHYSDTNYVLLGQVLAAATGTPLAAALRSLLDFEGRGLTATSLESLEAVPASAGPRAGQYVGDHRLNDISPTIDLYGGGGLVSSMADLATFFRALLDGRIFEHPATLDAMLSIDPVLGDNSGSGIFRTTLADHTCWFHDGLWGLVALTCPDLDITVAWSWNQAVPSADFDPNATLIRIVQLVLENGRLAG